MIPSDVRMCIVYIAMCIIWWISAANR